MLRRNLFKPELEVLENRLVPTAPVPLSVTLISGEEVNNTEQALVAEDGLMIVNVSGAPSGSYYMYLKGDGDIIHAFSSRMAVSGAYGSGSVILTVPHALNLIGNPAANGGYNIYLQSTEPNGDAFDSPIFTIRSGNELDGMWQCNIATDLFTESSVYTQMPNGTYRVNVVGPLEIANQAVEFRLLHDGQLVQGFGNLMLDENGKGVFFLEFGEVLPNGVNQDAYHLEVTIGSWSTSYLINIRR